MLQINNFSDVLSLLGAEPDVLDKKPSARNNDSALKYDFKEVLDRAVKSNNQANSTKQKNEVYKVKETSPEVEEIADEQKRTNTVEEPSLDDNTKMVSSKNSDEVEPLKDDEFIKKLASELDIDPNALLKLLEALNIDINGLKDNSNVNMAIQQIQNCLEDFIAKMNTAVVQNISEDSSFKGKVNLVVNLHSKVETENVDNMQTESQQNQLAADGSNTKTETKIQDLKVSANDTLTKNNQPTETSSGNVPVQTKNTESQSKTPNEETNINSDTPADKPKSAAKQDYLTKADNIAADEENVPKDNNKASGTNKQDASTNTALYGMFDKVKVVNSKVNFDVNVKTDEQNIQQILQMQSQENKSIPVKNILSNIHSQKADVFSQIVENAKLILSEKQTEMELNLKPDSLGKLSLKIATENGLIVAKFTAESQQVKEIIESNLIQLKEALKNQGIAVQEFSVSVGQDARQELFNRYSYNQKSQRISDTKANYIEASENYYNSQTVKNPYLVSYSSVEYTA